MSLKINFTNGGLPLHLGGHENETHLDEGALNYLIEALGVKSMVDIGCGPAGMVELARSKGIEVLGVDGDFVVDRKVDDIVIHDYQVAPYIPQKNYDLAWTVEFVEHIEEGYIRNFVASMDKCKYVLMTHAFPGQAGHHHVNCQVSAYWIHLMNAFGYTLDQEHLQKIREASTMKERYIRDQSLFFVNRIYTGA
jgi:hypothetical protein